ncbi:hypothetical protein ACT3UM_15110 [Halomonas sp. AOP13-D3-9]
MTYDSFHPQEPALDGIFLSNQPSHSQQVYQPISSVGASLGHLMPSIPRTRRLPKLCNANLVREIIHHYYRLAIDPNGVNFLLPHSSGPVLIMEAEMIAPIIKKIVADSSNRDVSDKNIQNALDIIRFNQADFRTIGNGRTWLGESNERFIELGGEVMMFPSGHESMVRPQQHYPYWQPINSRPYSELHTHGRSADLNVIETYVALPKDRELLIYTYMVLCLMPERQQLALELTGEPKSGMSRLQRIIKNLVDPVIKETAIRDIPTTVKKVNRLAWQHQVISLENVEAPLSAVVQRRLFELLCTSQLEWRANDGNETTSSLDVSRPCVLSSLEPVICHDELAELTLSLEMPSPSIAKPRETYRIKTRHENLTPVDQTCAFSALLILLGKAHANIDQVRLEREVPDNWQDFCRIGMIVSDNLVGNPEGFWTQYQAYRSERLCEMTEEEPVAQALIKYLKIEAITEAVEKPTGVWLATLTKYRPSCTLDSQWPREPRGLGAAFKRAASLLNAQGIICYSNGKRGSKRHWVIGPTPSPHSISVSNGQTSGSEHSVLGCEERDFL